MSMKKVVVWGGVALVVFFIITQPSQAASLVTETLGSIKEGATGLITFVKELFK